MDRYTDGRTDELGGGVGRRLMSFEWGDYLYRNMYACITYFMHVYIKYVYYILNTQHSTHVGGTYSTYGTYIQYVL